MLFSAHSGDGQGIECGSSRPDVYCVTTPPTTPPSPRLFLVDGYALIYRAFFALISRPLTTSRGENTSAAWGIVNFLQRLLQTHHPDYLGWVHDSGLSFRHERYPAYKATREKLTEELQSDFDRGMERIRAILDASHIPILTLPGYEADDVIGTLAVQGAAADLNVVVVSGDKDFQQLVRPGIWLLNPGRGGPASVEEQWVERRERQRAPRRSAVARDGLSRARRRFVGQRSGREGNRRKDRAGARQARTAPSRTFSRTRPS